MASRYFPAISMTDSLDSGQYSHLLGVEIRRMTKKGHWYLAEFKNSSDLRQKTASWP